MDRIFNECKVSHLFNQNIYYIETNRLSIVIKLIFDKCQTNVRGFAIMAGLQ